MIGEGYGDGHHWQVTGYFLSFACNVPTVPSFSTFYVILLLTFSWDLYSQQWLELLPSVAPISLA
jgi:hypothetical protein